MSFIQIATLAALTAWAHPLSGQVERDPEDLNALAAQARQDAGAPALGLVVIREGDQPKVAVDGVRVFGSETPVTIDDQWHWGSITKSMTATLVARLAEKDIVSWNDTVGDLLGEVVPNMHEDYRAVTFRHLLSHRAGLAANIPMERFADFGQSPDDPIADRLEWVRIALSQQPVGEKGTTYEYSNNGVIVAGAMLEAATGEPWGIMMQREVFSPLGIAGAGFGPPRGPQPDDQPRGHQSVDGVDKAVPLGADNPAALGPAGRVHMPLADMARFLLAHARKRSDFLRPESYELLHSTPFGGNYAMGWVVISPETRWHNGSNTMWYAEAIFNLTDGTVAAVVVNDGDIGSVQPVVRTLLRKLMEEQK